MQAQHQAMFTALMTREIKNNFDSLYKTYKDNLCEVSEVDPQNVKQQLIQQTQEFFANLRKQTSGVKQIVRNKVKDSQNLKDLENLIESNQEYFGETAGAEIDREKLKFD